MGFSGAVGVNMMAIDLAMKDYNVPKDEKIHFSLKVREIAGIIIAAQAEEARSKRKKK